MADIVYIQDLFEGIPADTDIAGRTPPVTNSGAVWQRESAFAGGDGAGNIKFNSGTALIKNLSVEESIVAVRVIWNDGGADNGGFVFVGDYTGSTIWPRRAYAASFHPRINAVRLYRIDEFAGTQIGPDITTATWNALGADNTFVLQRNGNDFQAMVNGVFLGGFTDATYAPNGTRKRHGFGPFATDQAGRLRSYEVLDSVTATPAGNQPYTIVEVF